MPPITNIPMSVRLAGARVLYRHWLKREAIEGFVREFSPDTTHVRISATARKKDHGAWHKADDLRCVEVLDAKFDFKAFESQEKEDRARRGDRFPGDDWKDSDE